MRPILKAKAKANKLFPIVYQEVEQNKTVNETMDPKEYGAKDEFPILDRALTTDISSRDNTQTTPTGENKNHDDESLELSASQMKEIRLCEDWFEQNRPIDLHLIQRKRTRQKKFNILTQLSTKKL